MKTYTIRPGWRYPFGTTVDAKGVNFSIWGQRATSAELLLYDQARSTTPFQVIRLDPLHHRTFYCWHVYVEGLPAGVSYNWRFDGPGDTQQSGFRFDPHKALLDPWARAITHDLWDRQRASQPGDNSACAMRTLVLYILCLLIFIPPRRKTIASCEARPPRTAQAAADSSTPRLETRSA